MPALDNCHPQVVNALSKEGWSILPVQYVLYSPVRQFFVDIQARRDTGSAQEQIAVVEAKCFSLPRSQPELFYTATGQYLVYRELLKPRNLQDALYLAVPVHAFDGIFKDISMNIVAECRIKLIVFDFEKEEIVRWIP